MGVLGQTLPPQGSRGILVHAVYCSSGRTIDDAGRPRILGARRAGMRTHNGMLSYVCAVCRLRGTEDGVRDYGGWAGDTWYRRGAPSKAGGPRSVRVCRSLKGKGQRPGLAANRLVDTVSCGCGGAADSRSAGPGGSRAAICTKSE
ncbi:hypothetical protein EVAR_76309_1 [Eumeta japonica]|uniref:Uncharacterized protein n=1 Tax=Eumeta variegata TaxID=151549 RepID=A0A4C1T7P4_EUMVA|nr:hypothetical protein EVAR_76309_1 [Eumeta japonica]